MSDPRQGDIWWAAGQDKRRPVLVVTRDQAIPVLNRLVVAPVTRTRREIPTEVTILSGEGLKVDCVASFDNLQSIAKRQLTERAGALAPGRRRDICRALDALADC